MYFAKGKSFAPNNPTPSICVQEFSHVFHVWNSEASPSALINNTTVSSIGIIIRKCVIQEPAYEHRPATICIVQNNKYNPVISSYLLKLSPIIPYLTNMLCTLDLRKHWMPDGVLVSNSMQPGQGTKLVSARKVDDHHGLRYWEGHRTPYVASWCMLISLIPPASACPSIYWRHMLVTSWNLLMLFQSFKFLSDALSWCSMF